MRPGRVARTLRRLCPHMLGWSTASSGRVRFCRCCAAPQRLVGGVWIFPAFARGYGFASGGVVA